jgi:hypothetical protein
MLDFRYAPKSNKWSAPNGINTNSSKMICYQLYISKNFPAYHIRRGEPTGFIDAIKYGGKLHTIRANYPLWQKRFEKIHAGNAYISIRQWEGAPYKSKHIELFRTDALDGIGLEKVVINKEFGVLVPTVSTLGILAQNDGLDKGDFTHWFTPYPLGQEWAIIHFTDFRYCH